MATTLNKWAQNSPKGFYTAAETPGHRYTRYLSFDVSHDHAMANNTVEYAQEQHLPGHPINKTIYHWVAAYGWHQSGAKTDIADPAGQSTAVSWGGGVNRTYQVNTRLMINLTSSHGVVW
jgi:hypothetical protein